MSQSTPIATTKRKVMGRMDAGTTESPSASVTPNARPRIIRAHHGYSSPSLSSSATSNASRPTPGTSRARVDMSTLASPSSVASSPAMSPSVSRRPKSAVSTTPHTITARLSATSPTVRSTPTFHGRSGSTVGVSAFSYRLAEARADAPADSSLAFLRSSKVRARNDSAEMSASPSATSLGRDSASSQLSASISLRSPALRADQSQFPRPSTPSASARPAPAIPVRHLLSTQRSQEKLDHGVAKRDSRSPSPVLNAAHVAVPGSASSPLLISSKHSMSMSESEPFVPDRQASIPVAWPTTIGRVESTRSINYSNGNNTSADDHSVYAISPSKIRPIGNVGAITRLEAGSAMTTGRASSRSGPVLQRSAMPPSFMDLASASALQRPSAEQRSSFASSTFSVHSTSQPLSPSSETPRSPSEVGEAEEARVHRKLLDLEITNKSLMAINSALEVTKLKQAKEIRELKRRLREGRGISVDPTARDSLGGATSSDEEDLEADSEDDDEFSAQEDPELEAAHQRCKNLVDSMVEQARKAILAEYEEPRGNVGKVLHPAELEEMQREMEQGNDTEADTTIATDLLNASVMLDHSTSKDDDLPSSSSLKFSQDSRIYDESLSAPNGTQQSDTRPSPHGFDSSGLHPNSAYVGNMPPLHGDVSID
ncbi:uncharacterized protein MEPE_03760 [Melanopsichium pennsylvanicum]|uniref:Uncharacterized protein n=2 Tax=Melanopsichium pennsylvanicum TaxID=63383 RepID=A0AAJ5C5T0_9BASI|nr:conserved hypothetical protein [Melanopsichium pennsylvanicum 4]SNX85051.1 uncharacterized protein MEPE_03760 [Melanopsichium pennsylvanicum]